MLETRRMFDGGKESFVPIELDFFLSEMSVSNGHGGGLTLQRVLGTDLDQVRLFAHVSRHATDFPAVARFSSRSLDIPMWTESETAYKVVGHTVAGWISKRPAVLRMNARRVAAIVDDRLGSKETVRGLVCPQTAVSLYAMKALASRRRVKYVTWIMDDHFVRWRKGRWEYPGHVENLLARHLKRAEAVFVISPVMSEFYRERFGVDSEVLYGPANPCAEPQWEIRHDSNRIRLGYFGSVAYWQLDALCLLIENLESANADLDIYTGGDSLLQQLQHPRVKHRGRIDPSAILETMRGYDAVVLPASFEPAIRAMSEFNIATKMSECLASGTVTLFVGPDYSAMGRFLEDHGAAVLVMDKSQSAVTGSIERLRSSESRRAVLESARKLVQSQMSVAVMHDIWLKGVARLN
jgi:glycosyltransferase involved in cell wall biosynthesis